MEFTALPSFERDFKKLPPDIQDIAKKQIELLRENPGHNSLETGKLGQKREGQDVWYVRITLSHRATFWWENDEITFRRIGGHDILDRNV